jgi:hypothetical protein
VRHYPFRESINFRGCLSRLFLPLLRVERQKKAEAMRPSRNPRHPRLSGLCAGLFRLVSSASDSGNHEADRFRDAGLMRREKTFGTASDTSISSSSSPRTAMRQTGGGDRGEGDGGGQSPDKSSRCDHPARTGCPKSYLKRAQPGRRKRNPVTNASFDFMLMAALMNTKCLQVKTLCRY